MRFTDATHNLLHGLPAEAWREDLSRSAAAHLRGFQEANDHRARTTLAEHCAALGHEVWHPTAGGNPIAWDALTFAATGYRINAMAHPSASAMGVPAKANPARFITGVGLTHLDTGQRLLRLNVHPTAGATDPTPEEAPAVARWKDWSIHTYWLLVAEITAREIRTERWDSILLGGDYNAAMDNRGEWFYPARLLEGLYRPDRLLTGLDHLTAARGSTVKPLARKAIRKGVHTDHALHFQTWEIHR